LIDNPLESVTVVAGWLELDNTPKAEFRIAISLVLIPTCVVRLLRLVFVVFRLLVKVVTLALVVASPFWRFVTFVLVVVNEFPRFITFVLVVPSPVNRVRISAVLVAILVTAVASPVVRELKDDKKLGLRSTLALPPINLPVPFVTAKLVDPEVRSPMGVAVATLEPLPTSTEPKVRGRAGAVENVTGPLKVVFPFWVRVPLLVIPLVVVVPVVLMLLTVVLPPRLLLPVVFKIFKLVFPVTLRLVNVGVATTANVIFLLGISIELTRLLPDSTPKVSP
jgi:hypothetical protein